MKLHGTSSMTERPVYTMFVPDFASLAILQPPAPRSVVLIAADGLTVSAETIAAVARHLLDLGLVYICAWGPGCERVHDVFDETDVGDGTTAERPATLMSTWHSSDTLAEAVAFFRDCAFPTDDDLEEACYVAIAVGHEEWLREIEEALGEEPFADEESATTEAG